MALFILGSIRRVPLAVNSLLVPSKYLSHASLAACNEPKPASDMNLALIKQRKFREQFSEYVQEHRSVVRCAKFQEYIRQYSDGSSRPGNCNPNQCSDEQLTIVFETLRKNLPHFFHAKIDFSIYHPQIIFENNIQGKRSIGIAAYVWKTYLLIFWGHYKYAHANMEILKITKHPEDSTVKIRWRISGITGFQMASQMWKYKMWQPQEMREQKITYIDGFSTMYVGKDGKIFKHVADKRIPDQNYEAKSKEISPLSAVPKMALYIVLSLDLSSMISG